VRKKALLTGNLFRKQSLFKRCVKNGSNQWNGWRYILAGYMICYKIKLETENCFSLLTVSA